MNGTPERVHCSVELEEMRVLHSLNNKEVSTKATDKSAPRATSYFFKISELLDYVNKARRILTGNQPDSIKATGSFMLWASYHPAHCRPMAFLKKAAARLTQIVEVT